MERKMTDLASISDLEVEPLSDEDLNRVAGGAEATSTEFGCSCACCVIVPDVTFTTDGPLGA